MNILMPQLGETVAEGKITKWFKSAGDAVKPGDNLFEIETDKVSMEVPATEAGVLSEIRVAEGEVAPVGAVVGVIGDECRSAASDARKTCAGGSRRRRNRPPPPLPMKAPGGSMRSAANAAAADQARSVLRGAHARTQFRPGAAVRRHRRHAAGAPARQRSRHRSLAICAAPARTAALSRAT